jgi:hypothetical protein
MAAISAGAWVGMTEKAPDESGFHFDRLKVAGDILPLPEGLPPARPDEHGFPRIESGAGSSQVRNDGIRPDRGSWRALSGMLQQTVTPGEDPGSI